MRRFSELPGGERRVEVLRWLGVLPTALLGYFATQFIVGAVVQVASYGGGGIAGDSSVVYLVKVFLYYVLPNAAFVVAGPKMAPRHQVATAILLTVLGFLLSLVKHLVGQHLGGNRIGLVNYTHFVAECAGMLGGAAYILLHDRGNRQPM